MKHAKKHHPKRIRKGLMSHPIGQWTRRTVGGNRDHYFTKLDDEEVHLAHEKGKKKLHAVKVFVDDSEIPGDWKKLWEHLHEHAHDPEMRKEV